MVVQWLSDACFHGNTIKLTGLSIVCSGQRKLTLQLNTWGFLHTTGQQTIFVLRQSV